MAAVFSIFSEASLMGRRLCKYYRKHALNVTTQESFQPSFWATFGQCFGTAMCNDVQHQGVQAIQGVQTSSRLGAEQAAWFSEASELGRQGLSQRAADR